MSRYLKNAHRALVVSACAGLCGCMSNSVETRKLLSCKRDVVCVKGEARPDYVVPQWGVLAATPASCSSPACACEELGLIEADSAYYLPHTSAGTIEPPVQSLQLPSVDPDSNIWSSDPTAVDKGSGVGSNESPLPSLTVPEVPSRSAPSVNRYQPGMDLPAPSPSDRMINPPAIQAPRPSGLEPNAASETQRRQSSASLDLPSVLQTRSYWEAQALPSVPDMADADVFSRKLPIQIE